MVEFVIEIRPIVVPIANEVRDGNLDARMLFSGTATMLRHDTIKVYKRDTIYIGQNEVRQTEKSQSVSSPMQPSDMGARPTAEEEQRLDHSSDNVSEQERKEIESGEASFRQRMRAKLNQHRTNQ